MMWKHRSLTLALITVFLVCVAGCASNPTTTSLAPRLSTTVPTRTVPAVGSPGTIAVPHIEQHIIERALSPNGDVIAFTSDIGCEDFCAPGEICDCWNYELFTHNLETGEVRQITDSLDPFQPFWSPSGEMIGFRSGGVIYAINADGTGLRVLAVGLSADWSADESRVIVADVESPRPGSGEDIFVTLSILDAITGEGEVVFEHPGLFAMDSGIAWSPDGRYVALAWTDLSATEMTPMAIPYVLDLETLDIIPLLAEETLVYILDWTMDGEWFAIRTRNGNGFIDREGTCLVMPRELEREHYRWVSFSGENSLLLTPSYIVDLNEVLGPMFPQGVLSCP